MLQEQEVRDITSKFLTDLRRRKIQGSSIMGRHTAEILRNLVASLKKNDKIQQLIDMLRLFGTLVQSEQHTLVTIGNIVRRVLYLVREEYIQGLKAVGDNSSASTNNTDSTTPASAMNNASVFQSMPQQQDHQPNLATLLEMGPEVDFNKTLGDFDNGTCNNKKKLNIYALR